MEERAKPAALPLADRVASLFIAPAKLFENIKVHPVWLLPFLICVAIQLLYLPLNDRYQDLVLTETPSFDTNTMN